MVAIFNACGGNQGKVAVTSSWINGEQICFLIHISDVPKDKKRRVTIIVTGGLLDVKLEHFDGANGDHKICIPIPGGMPGPSTHVTANVYGSDPDDAEGSQPRPAPPVPGSEADDATKEKYKKDKEQWDKDSKKWEKKTEIDNKEVKDINKTAPTLPEGTISH
jgi:hypothetical protein